MLYVRRILEDGSYVIKNTSTRQIKAVSPETLRELFDNGEFMYGVSVKDNNLRVKIFNSAQHIVDIYTVRQSLSGGCDFEFTIKSTYYSDEAIIAKYIGDRNKMNIKIPEFVESLDNRCFQDCRFEKIKLPANLKSINYSAFARCANLIEIELPTTLQCVGSLCFSYCNSLKHIEIPNNVTHLSHSCFINCKSLEYAKLNGKYEVLGSYMFSGCTKLKSVTLGRNIKILPDACFQECTALESINLDNNIVSINESAFCNCTSLKHIELPDTLKYIGTSAFKLSGLESIKLPSTLYFLGRFAFTGCKSLTTVTAVFDDLGTLSSYREPVSIYNLNNLHVEAEVNSLETIDERFEDCCTLKKIITTRKLYNKYFKLCLSCKDVEFELH